MYRLEGGILYTLDSEHPVWDDGALVVRGDRIAYVGSRQEMPPEYRQTPVYPMHGKLICPGFVNIHTHAALTIMRGIGDDLGVAPAYSQNAPQGVFMSAEEAQVMSMLGGLEALKFGTTCIVDNYIYADQAARAFDDLGMRAVVSERLHDADLFKVPHEVYAFDEETGSRLLYKAMRLCENWHGHSGGRITCRLGPHAADTCSTHYLMSIRSAAENLGLGLVTHVAQSKREGEEIRKRSGKSPVEYLDDLGLLSPQMIAGHCIYVSDTDIEILADTGTHVSHQSGSNSKGGMMAPIRRMHNQGINIGLGTDNMAGDMLEVMRLAVLVARMLDEDQTALMAQDAFRMATVNGARALGMEDEIGTLEVGKKADFIAIGLEKPHLTPLIDPIANLIHNGLGSDVEMVAVDGRILIEDGRHTQIDEQNLLREAQNVAQRLWQKMPDRLPEAHQWFRSIY